MKKPDVAKTPSKTVRGKYIHLLEQGSNVAVLDRDLVDRFPDSASVNRALRVYLRMQAEFDRLHEDLTDSLGGRETPLPFDPRTGRRADQLSVAK